MLPKRNRADRKTVEKIFKEGRFVNSPNLTFKFIINKSSSVPVVSFIAPKSVAKLAVKRNSLRRRGYRVLKNFIGSFPAGIAGVFVFRNRDVDSLTLQNEIKNILSKVN